MYFFVIHYMRVSLSALYTKQIVWSFITSIIFECQHWYFSHNSIQEMEFNMFRCAWINCILIPNKLIQN